MTQPIGVSTHRIGSDLPEQLNEQLKSIIPTVEQLEIELQTINVESNASDEQL
jgi:uncharacterized protein (UPF0335 family)